MFEKLRIQNSALTKKAQDEALNPSKDDQAKSTCPDEKVFLDGSVHTSKLKPKNSYKGILLLDVYYEFIW
jgi:hypothetical protein